VNSGQEKRSQNPEVDQIQSKLVCESPGRPIMTSKTCWAGVVFTTEEAKEGPNPYCTAFFKRTKHCGRFQVKTLAAGLSFKVLQGSRLIKRTIIRDGLQQIHQPIMVRFKQTLLHVVTNGENPPLAANYKARKSVPSKKTDAARSKKTEQENGMNK